MSNQTKLLAIFFFLKCHFALKYQTFPTFSSLVRISSNWTFHLSPSALEISEVSTGYLSSEAIFDNCSADSFPGLKIDFKGLNIQNLVEGEISAAASFMSQQMTKVIFQKEAFPFKFIFRSDLNK